MFRLAVLVSGLFFPSCHLSTSIFCSAARPLLLLRLRPRPTPTTAMDMALVATPDTATPDLATDVDTDTLALATAVDTPPLDTPDSATLVATLDSATEATDTPVVTTASVRLRPSLRLMQLVLLT